MANWAYIENGQIIEKYDILPDSWKNISNFFALKDEIEFLQDLGWVPIVHPEYNIDKSRQQLTNCRWTIDGMTVTEHYDIVDIPIATTPIVETPNEIESSPPILTFDDIKNLFISEVKNRLDNFAKTRGYDDITSAVTYANDINPVFQIEGSYCLQARSLTYSKLFSILSDIELGVIPMTTSFYEIEQELPILQWPE